MQTGDYAPFPMRCSVQILHLVMNVSAFVNVEKLQGIELNAQQLAIVAASEVNLALNDEAEALVAETSTNVKNSSVTIKSVGGGNAFNASIIPHLPLSLKFGSSVTELDRKGLGSLGHPGTIGEEKESGIHISELPRESIANSCQSRGTDTGISSAKVTEASVQALKKPTRGFGALLVKGDEQPKQLKRSRWSLLHLQTTFNPSHLLPVVNSQNLSQKSPVVLEVQYEEAPAEPSAREEDSAEPALKMDEQNELMSLSDSSTSFQECLQSIKPFDFEAVRKQIKFGEAPKEDSVRMELGIRRKVQLVVKAKKMMEQKNFHKVNTVLLFQQLGIEVQHLAESQA
ncbi:hypothetical protein Pint_20022 [Pistacia integerrima]|uniref:Uncharacterized protein n=1 Tax=Pistacia integerrima TaxID=434235 RepID=A0ACC0XDQ5_9ROSI|nr:hypothetical protein Pint_20022 [Pistacia integerrima]